MLCQIMSYLDVHHRLVASLVCRRWFLASSTQLEDVCLNLNKHQNKPFPTLPLTRHFCNASLRSYAGLPWIDFLGPQLLHLTFIPSGHPASPMVIDCPKLLTLVTNSADVVTALVPPVASLQSLDLSHVMGFSDETRGVMEAIAPNLREFTIPVNLAVGRLVDKRFYLPYLLTPGDVEAFIAKRAATLTSLRLPFSILADDALRIASTPGLALTNVNMERCICLIDRLGEFFEMQPRVVELNLLGVAIEYEELETVLRLLPDLRVFSLCSRFEKRALALVFRMRHLRRLRFDCDSIPPDAFSTFASVDLRVLDVGGSPFDSKGVGMWELLKRAPSFRELKMGAITKRFFRDGPNLRITTQDLSGRPNIRTITRELISVDKLLAPEDT